MHLLKLIVKKIYKKFETVLITSFILLLSVCWNLCHNYFCWSLIHLFVLVILVYCFFLQPSVFLHYFLYQLQNSSPSVFWFCIFGVVSCFRLLLMIGVCTIFIFDRTFFSFSSLIFISTVFSVAHDYTSGNNSSKSFWTCGLIRRNACDTLLIRTRIT